MRFVALPFRDAMSAAEAMSRRGGVSWLALALAFVATWFVYVPVHELLHAAGCIATGGAVTRLEIAPEYGGALVAALFPFVASGSRYAGQLTGFDVQGSDVTYLATVLAPYALTVLIGVPLLEHAARLDASSRAQPWLLGIALPLALVPFGSMAGDFYEAGSIVVTRALLWAMPPIGPLTHLRSDDLVALAGRLADASAPLADWSIVVASSVAGLVLALATYHLGACVARLVLRRSRIVEFSENAS